MQNELDILEQKLAQLIAVTQNLRSENHRLRQEVASALSLNRLCQDKVEQATARIDLLLSNIPENAL